MKTKTKNKKSVSEANAKKLRFWIQFHKNDEKQWLNLYVPDNAGDDEEELADYLVSNQHIFGLQCDIEPQGYGAHNWEIVSIEDVVHDFSTTTEFDYEHILSPEEEKEAKEKEKIDNKITKIVFSKKPLALTKGNVKINDNSGVLDISLPALNINDKIDFSKIWDTLEKDFIGKIQEGDTVTLMDDDGNKIFEMTGGSFLNVGIADLRVYDAKKNPNPEESSMLDSGRGLKGGLFVRDNGDLAVGDFKRTFYLHIYTNNLLKASMKLKKSLMELTQTKLLKK